MKSAPEVTVQDQQKKIRFSSTQMIPWVKKILRALGWDRVKLDILVVDDRQMQKFHRHYLKENSPTDVMAFSPALRFSQAHGVPFLGNIVISVETAYRTAPQFGHTGDRELLLYACHGILHLMGERDDAPRRKARMDAIQQKVLKKILGRKWHFKKPKRLF